MALYTPLMLLFCWRQALLGQMQAGQSSAAQSSPTKTRKFYTNRARAQLRADEPRARTAVRRGSRSVMTNHEICEPLTQPAVQGLSTVQKSIWRIAAIK